MVVFLVAHLVGCDYAEPKPEQLVLRPNAPISLAAEVAAGWSMVIPEGVVFGGTVTANDVGGNFYRTIVVEDESGAVELNVGLYDLHNRFPIGSRVRIDAGGLVVMLYEGVVQMGRAIYPYNSHTVEPLGTHIEVDRRIEVEEEVCALEPQNIVVGQTEGDMCGRLVRVSAVRYVGQPSGWATERYGSMVERCFATPQNDTIVVATSRYADFASEPIPHDRLSLSGILYLEESLRGPRYKLRLRSLDDVKVE